MSRLAQCLHRESVCVCVWSRRRWTHRRISQMWGWPYARRLAFAVAAERKSTQALAFAEDAGYLELERVPGVAT